MSIDRVIFVPNEGDPRKFLAGGMGGARPPIAGLAKGDVEDDNDIWAIRGSMTFMDIFGEDEKWGPKIKGLVLVWDGVVSLDGWYRATRETFSVPGNWTPAHPPVTPDMCMNTALRLAEMGLGTVVWVKIGVK